MQTTNNGCAADRCHQCGGVSRVINTRPTDEPWLRWRRRKCLLCDQRWNTYESRYRPSYDDALYVRAKPIESDNIHTPHIELDQGEHVDTRQLRKIRKAAGVSQSDVAFLLGVERDQIVRIEAGKKTPSALVLKVYKRLASGGIQ